ncbi:hypothetical protein LIER_41555 [Lithospermum erythrorhizon]|uniref:F-box domain-containing protein n=1 Tax=Lithospermum erythrorhizon TaxID=34254 RepID=A0AAV3RGZ0_LITER
MTEKTISELNTSRPDDYDDIVNLVRSSCGDKVVLPGVLVSEILSNLPVKSLIRFQTVCKPWNRFIFSPAFINKHLHRKNPQLGGYSKFCDKEFYSHKDEFVFPAVVDFIVGACNGIICIKTSHIEKSLILFNPATREFSFLAKDECDGTIFGFCYIYKTQEYQVIAFKEKRHVNNIDIKILTMGKTKSLREVRDVVLPGRITDSRQATSGTTMVWLGVDHEEVNDIVICYDAIEERFSRIDVPPYDSPPHLWTRSLRVLKESVIMFVYSNYEANTSFDIWTLIIDEGSKDKHWMKYRTIGPLKTGGIMWPIEVCWYEKWILCRKDGNDQEDLKYRSNDLFYYDLETDQVEDYNKLTDPPIQEFVNYVESLVSIKSLVQSVDTNY